MYQKASKVDRLLETSLASPDRQNFSQGNGTQRARRSERTLVKLSPQEDLKRKSFFLGSSAASGKTFPVARRTQQGYRRPPRGQKMP